MYFDYAATTPPNEEVLKTFDAVNRDFWANPHAMHRPGVRAETLLEQARQQILGLLRARNDYNCIFTSGATESNNMAIKGVARHSKNRGRHLITSAAEHPSVTAVFQWLKKEGWEISVLPVDRSGLVEPGVLKNALRADTTLVSLMHVNNEVGALHDIHALGRLVKENSNAVFHVDAAQSVGKIPLQLDGGPVDLLTFSAHKFFGLKGSGALIMPKKMELPALLQGGGQEAGFRSGTGDPGRAAAMAKALRLSLDGVDEMLERVTTYRGQIADVLAAIPDATLNGTLENSVPFILNVSISGVRPETVLQGLAEKEIYISTVSACSARKAAESLVVYALTGDHERAKTSVRISLSALTTKSEVDTLCETLPAVIESLRVKRK